MALWQSGQKAKARRYLGNEYRAALDTYCQNCLEAEKQGRTALPTADQLRNVDREATEMCFSESDDSLPEQHAIPLPADSSVQRGTEAFLDTNVFAWITNERKRMKDRATKLFNEQRDRPAIRAYSELMETYPDEGCLVLNHKNRGIAYSRLRDFDHALSDLNTASELAPNDWEVVAARAKVFSSLRRFDEALMEIDQLIRANYQVKKTHFERAYILAQLRRYEEAIESIQNCLNVEDADFDPTIPKCDLHAFQGAIYLRGLRDASRAVAELTSALESDPWLSYRYDEPFLFRLRAEAHRSLGAQEKAEADEESAEEIELGSKAHTNQPQ
jgi:tetratricopeptide (TPR) repeat protein